MMNRQSKHLAARDSVIARLRALGVPVEAVPRALGFDFLVHGNIRVSLRVAFPGHYAHTVMVAGRRYAYDYRSWSFNFHRHGNWNRDYCDIIVCIAKRRGGADETFIIPATSISGPTFSLHGAGTKPYRGRYSRFRDRWDLLTTPIRPNHESQVA